MMKKMVDTCIVPLGIKYWSNIIAFESSFELDIHMLCYAIIVFEEHDIETLECFSDGQKLSKLYIGIFSWSWD